ncbi:rh blood group, D antigen isoform X2 [Neoarius graeffei]|uniref:rh blood group, D antigen isoform X2 n=1 Tax=Neoarius graeffei TaxID=443677 RepID=UPI00298C4432|nr:rh blood group, D antigen isoform X2 [Neoarius graeffei]
MAPKYAPSLRAQLPPVALLLQIAFIVIFAFCVEIKDYEKEKKEIFMYSYAKFQDIHVMVFLGFGFLGTFLVRYGFSSSAFSLLVAAMAVQWATILNGFLLSYSFNWNIQINLKNLVDAELCAASALVAMGAIHGKTNPAQLLIFTLIEVTGFVLNQWLIKTIYKIQTHWVYNLALINIFGALFGMMTSFLLFRSKMQPKHEKEKVNKTTGLFAMFGTLFLWMFWPSFNSVLEQNFSVLCSTYLSLAVSAITATAVSVLSSSKGKINLRLLCVKTPGGQHFLKYSNLRAPSGSNQHPCHSERKVTLHCAYPELHAGWWHCCWCRRDLNSCSLDRHDDWFLCYSFVNSGISIFEGPYAICF